MVKLHEQSRKNGNKQKDIQMNGRGVVLVAIVVIIILFQIHNWIKYDAVVKPGASKYEPLVFSWLLELGVSPGHWFEYTINLGLNGK